MYPLLFNNNLHKLVWGGTKLKDLKGLPHDEQPIGESWEISDMPDNESVVSNGQLAGKTLGELVATYKGTLVGKAVYEKYGNTFPLLVKFIDAAHDLSIQVHPNDELAQARHHASGKNEMWYVMQAEPGATLLSGFSKKITKEEYQRRVDNGTIIDVLARHAVSPGDVFFIPAGRIHAICGGIMVCEIQQSSDITYRLYDYHRKGLDGRPRELHTELAKDAIDYEVYPDYRTHYKPVREGSACVANYPFFVVNVLSTRSRLNRRLKKEDSFVTLSCLSGTALVTDADGHSVSLPVGQSCLIPADVADYSITSIDNSEVKLLEALIHN